MDGSGFDSFDGLFEGDPGFFLENGNFIGANYGVARVDYAPRSRAYPWTRVAVSDTGSSLLLLAGSLLAMCGLHRARPA